MADNKYHQVAVPDHPGGSSFLRLGSFPSGGDPAPLPAGFEKARALAGVSAARATTSGHWSHTDGNRITTTVGNVVDVINGSYIAVRSAAASPPGPALTASWSSWSYTQTGSVDYPVGGGGSAGDPTGSQPDSFQVTYGQTGGATDSTTADGKASNGDVIAATWAGRSMTYVGSASKPVPYVFTQTYGGKVATYTYTTVANETLTTATGGDVSTTVNVSGGGSVMTTTTVNGGNSVTKTTADQITAVNTSKAITNVNTAANILNQSIGFIENTNEGVIFNLNLGFTSNVTIGGQFDFTAPERFDLSPETTEISGIKSSIEGVTTRIGAAETKIQGVETKITDVETAIQAEAAKITAAETAITDVKTDIGAVNTKIADEETQIKALNTKISDLDVYLASLTMLGY